MKNIISWATGVLVVVIAMTIAVSILFFLIHIVISVMGVLGVFLPSAVIIGIATYSGFVDLGSSVIKVIKAKINLMKHKGD